MLYRVWGIAIFCAVVIALAAVNPVAVKAADCPDRNSPASQLAGNNEFAFDLYKKIGSEETKTGSLLRRYIHLGTGNYHPKTARLYSDFGLLTCNEEIGADVNEVFKQLTGLGRAQTLKHLWQAPFSLQQNILAAIQQAMGAS